MQAMVLSIIGKDRPGLIKEISQCVTQANGNWLQSRFCHLSGQFAGFVEVMLPLDQHEALVKACQDIESLNITLAPAELSTTERTQTLNIVVTGNDRQGIVSDISQTLSNMNVSIEEMETTCTSAPNWGSPIFTTKMFLACQQETDIDEVKEALEQITDDLVVEFL